MIFFWIYYSLHILKNTLTLCGAEVMIFRRDGNIKKYDSLFIFGKLYLSYRSVAMHFDCHYAVLVSHYI